MKLLSFPLTWRRMYVPEDVAQEMVESGYVCEGDHKTMAKAIKDRVSLIKRKREQRQLVREEQEKRKQEESSFKQQNEQQTSVSQAGVQQLPAASTGIPTAPTTSASVSTQVEPEEPEADQHQQHSCSISNLVFLCCLMELLTVVKDHLYSQNPE